MTSKEINDAIMQEYTELESKMKTSWAELVAAREVCATAEGTDATAAADLAWSEKLTVWAAADAAAESWQELMREWANVRFTRPPWTASVTARHQARMLRPIATDSP